MYDREDGVSEDRISRLLEDELEVVRTGCEDLTVEGLCSHESRPWWSTEIRLMCRPQGTNSDLITVFHRGTVSPVVSEG